MSNLLLNKVDDIGYWLFTGMYGKYIPDKKTIYSLLEGTNVLCFVMFLGESEEYGCNYKVSIEILNNKKALEKDEILNMVISNALRISNILYDTIKIDKVNKQYKIVSTYTCNEYRNKLEGLLLAIYGDIEDGKVEINNL